jgi:hypothetical protein
LAQIDDVICVGETAGGALVCLINGERRYIPKSLVHDDSDVYEDGQTGTLVIPEWFATKEGLI